MRFRLEAGKHSLVAKDSKLYIVTSCNLTMWPTDELFSFGAGKPRPWNWIRARAKVEEDREQAKSKRRIEQEQESGTMRLMSGTSLIKDAMEKDQSAVPYDLSDAAGIFLEKKGAPSEIEDLTGKVALLSDVLTSLENSGFVNPQVSCHRAALNDEHQWSVSGAEQRFSVKSQQRFSVES